ncbi:polysaccharide export protein Wza [Cobetia crustatorum]|uniref:Polysaccharide export protein Wza n=2 Tax=Halomonadaceae TaxID=28256 RepID=A0A558HNT8_9GAMM|nr:polysaccharide export protein Wza [Cobetia crustatorum]
MEMPVRSTLKALSLATLLVAVGGCAFAPGGHMDYEAEVAPLSDQVTISPITPGLIGTYRSRVAQTAPASAELVADLQRYVYRVGGGDVLDINLSTPLDLAQEAGVQRQTVEALTYTVQPDGTLFYPYVGRINVKNKTVDEVRAALVKGLSRYITEPQVNISVAQFRSQRVYLSGAVTEPGFVPVTDVPLTLIDAISASGGVTTLANTHNITLTRNGKQERLSLYQLLQEGDMRQNRLLKDGDVINVPVAEDQNVFVLGQVLKPGNMPVGNERLSLTDALSRAGGVDEERADPSGIFVVRENAPDSDKLATVFILDISDATSLMLGARFPLQPRDVVYVTAAPVSRWNRVLSQLLPSVTSTGAFVSVIDDIED